MRALFQNFAPPLIVGILALLLSGCIELPSQRNEKAFFKFQVGIDRQQDIEGRLGVPYKIRKSPESGTTTLYYRTDNSREPSTSKHNAQGVTFTFDKNGVLLRKGSFTEGTVL
jgi:hypothetical protein